MSDAQAQAEASPGAASADEAKPLGPPPLKAMAGMAGLFVISIVLAMIAAPLYNREVGPIFENPQDVSNAGVYLLFVVAFTAVILLLARYKQKWLIQGVILGAILLSLVYLFGPLLSAALRPALGEAAVNPAWIGAIALSTVLAVLLWKRPEWWLVDTVGVGVSAGAGAYFGISFGLLPALALLIGFAVYDAIAVYRTKHMITLADSVMDLQLPLMLIVPKQRGYSFLKEKTRLKEKLEKGEEREALFMGLGDVAIPCVLVVSALQFLPATVRVAGLGGNLVVSIGTLSGALLGYGVLMALVAKGKAQAGLPSLNGGAIAGFFATLLPLYGIAPLIPA